MGDVDVIPPSTTKHCPVTKADSEEANQTAVAATSSGIVMDRIGSIIAILGNICSPLTPDL